LVEIAGANREEVRDLLARQGKFEAKIGNDTVFRGGTDITYVCSSADCSGIDPQVGCQQDGSEWFCGFRFSISLSPDAAKEHAQITANLGVDSASSGKYLDQPLDLYLDDSLVDSLRIGAELKGRELTDISISGSGRGTQQAEARNDAFANMKRLQTILKTGSLPVKLEVVKMDAISPALGKQFTKNAVIVSLVALGAVALIIFIRYRKLSVSMPMLVCMLFEAVIILGFAAVAGWNIDIAAVAGILVAIGTGVDDQIVIIDEAIGRKESRAASWKERMKQAFFIIMAAYATAVVAMIPLYFAGAGLLKGFALTSIIGVTAGVFITRPMYAAMVRILVEKD
jgi:preprotein translocase subunit SecD